MIYLHIHLLGYWPGMLLCTYHATDTMSEVAAEALTDRAFVLELTNEQQDMVDTGSGDGSIGRVPERLLKDDGYVLACDGR